MNAFSERKNGFFAQGRRFPVLYGFAWSLFWAVIGTITMGIWAHYADFSQNAVVVGIYGIHGVAIFLGGLVSSRHAGVRGWFYGGMTGFVYCLAMLVISLTVYNTFSLDAPGFLRICILTLIGAFSGMIGVNIPYKG